MRQRSRAVFSLLLWLLASSVAVAATPPAKVVQQFVDAHLQGRFAEARGFAMEQAVLNTSLFSGWLFGAGGAQGDVGTGDIFLSRQFVQAFRYTIIGTTSNGENQMLVTAVRSTPNLAHLYTWALAPKQGAAPYTLIEAIDAYLTKVNFPVEESRMNFTLTRETGEWYISVVYDEKFVQLRQQWLPAQSLSAALPLPGASTPVPGALAAAPSGATTTTDNLGRQVADAQFQATMQSVNRPYQAPAASVAPQAKAEENSSFMDRIAGIFSRGGKKDGSLPQISNSSLQQTFFDIRDALARYAASNNGFPGVIDIYDWQSLRQVINRFSKKELPATEAEVGFRFVDYRLDPGREDYTLLVELQESQNGLKRVEVTPYGIDTAN